MTDYGECGYGNSVFTNGFLAIFFIGFKFLFVCAFVLGVMNALSPIFDHSAWNTFACVLSCILSCVLLIIFIWITYVNWRDRNESRVSDTEGNELLFNFGVTSICLTALLILNFTDPVIDLETTIFSRLFLAFGCYVGMAGMLFSDSFKIRLNW